MLQQQRMPLHFIPIKVSNISTSIDSSALADTNFRKAQFHYYDDVNNISMTVANVMTSTILIKLSF